MKKGGYKVANLDITEACRIHKVKKWKVAQELGISDSSFSRKLRVELPVEEKQKIFNIIEMLEK